MLTKMKLVYNHRTKQLDFDKPVLLNNEFIYICQDTETNVRKFAAFMEQLQKKEKLTAQSLRRYWERFKKSEYYEKTK